MGISKVLTERPSPIKAVCSGVVSLPGNVNRGVVSDEG